MQPNSPEDSAEWLATPEQFTSQSAHRALTTRALVFRWVVVAFSIALFLSTCALMGMGVAWLRNHLDALPTIDYLEHYQPQIPSRLLDSRGELIHEVLGRRAENRQQVTREDLPDHLVQAVVALEDKRFLDHPGVDPIRIPKAAWVNFVAGRIREGASTLTQQLAKDLFVTEILGSGPRKRTYTQKMKEAWRALQIERRYSKSEILEIYLNQVYIGDRRQNIMGVAAASQYYFGKPVSQLALKECAMLAGILQSPASWSPFESLKHANRRTRIALRAMLNEGYIAEEEYQQAVNEPLRLRDRSTRRKLVVNKYPYFNEFARRQFQRGEIRRADGTPIVLAGSGVDVETTLDGRLQEAAIAALRRGIVDHEDRRRTLHGSRWGERVNSEPNADSPVRILPGYTYDAYVAAPYRPGDTEVLVTFPRIEGESRPHAAIFNATESWLDDFGLLKPDGCVRVHVESSPAGLVYRVTREQYVQGALVALRPSTGEILALVGGYDFFDRHNRGEFIRATQARRQPGSAFKPLLYACALDRGFHPASLIEDREQTFHFAGKTWTPENFEGEYTGMVTLHEALAESLNAGSVWLLQHLRRSSQSAGILAFHRFCRQKFDLRLHKSDLTIALGSEEVTPLQLAQAYAVFANGGFLVEPYALSVVQEQKRSRDQVSRTLYEHAWKGRRTMDPAHARVMVSLLEGVVEYGTGHDVASQCKVPVVGKTGTTDNCTNAWFAGFGKDLVCVVYVGFELNRSLGDRMTGRRVALPIWIEFMNRAAEIRPELFGEFDMPEGVVERRICLDSGALSTPQCRRSRTRNLLFPEDRAPSLPCPLHSRPEAPPLAFDVLESGLAGYATMPEGAAASDVGASSPSLPVPVPGFTLPPISPTETHMRPPFPSRTAIPAPPTPTPRKKRSWWRF